MGKKKRTSIEIKYILMIVLVCICSLLVNVLVNILIRINSYKILMNMDILHDEKIVSIILDDNDNNKGEISRVDFSCNNIKKTLLFNINNDKYIVGKGNRIIIKMYCNNFFDNFIMKMIVNNSSYIKEACSVKKDIYNMSKYYPVLINSGMNNSKDIFSFENSWSSPRTYGGNRKHEGTDIMYKDNKPDEVPVISISDGLVVNKGWLNLGGYRLYIRASDNLYFYYAHLSSYEPNVEIGDKVYAGQILGYMGSTGYGNEGTKDKFPVHLHTGVYYKDRKGVDRAINPYYLLKFLEFNKLYYKN